MRLFIFCSVLAAVGLPAAASAHVHWFVRPNAAQPVEPFQIADPAVLLWIAIIVAIVLLGVAIERRVGTPFWEDKALNARPRKLALQIFAIILGVGLVLSSLENTILVPPFEALTSLEIGLRWLEFFLGVLLISGRLYVLSGFGLIALYAGVLIAFGWYEGSEHLHIFGSGLFLFIASPHIFTRHRFERFAIPLLRGLAGVSLIILGLHEKILHPEIGLAFLETHPWNFMNDAFGLGWFSDRLFILSAGMTEIAIGVMLILGPAVRITVIVLSFFFAITAAMLGPVEVIGHLPIVAIAWILLVYGPGSHLRLTKLKFLGK